MKFQYIRDTDKNPKLLKAIPPKRGPKDEQWDGSEFSGASDVLISIIPLLKTIFSVKSSTQLTKCGGRKRSSDSHKDPKQLPSQKVAEKGALEQESKPRQRQASQWPLPPAFTAANSPFLLPRGSDPVLPQEACGLGG